MSEVAETTKKCSKCGEVKPLDAFSLHSSGPLGHHSWCKACVAEYDKITRAQRREYYRERRRLYRAVDPEETRHKRTKYRKDNRAKISRYQKEYGKRRPKQRHAILLANEAKHTGELQRPECCEICHRNTTLQMHHQNYSRPLEVNWLCRQCHATIHVAVRDLQEIASEQCSLRPAV